MIIDPEVHKQYVRADEIHRRMQKTSKEVFRPFIAVETAIPIPGGIRFEFRLAPNPRFLNLHGPMQCNPDEVVTQHVDVSNTLLRHWGWM